MNHLTGEQWPSQRIDGGWAVQYELSDIEAKRLGLYMYTMLAIRCLCMGMAPNFPASGSRTWHAPSRLSGREPRPGRGNRRIAACLKAVSGPFSRAFCHTCESDSRYWHRSHRLQGAWQLSGLIVRPMVAANQCSVPGHNHATRSQSGERALIFSELGFKPKQSRLTWRPLAKLGGGGFL